jgi:hypothetical protein
LEQLLPKENLIPKKEKNTLVFYVKGKTGSYGALYLVASLLELFQRDAWIPKKLFTYAGGPMVKARL